MENHIIDKKVDHFDIDYTMDELKGIMYALNQSVIVAITDHRGAIIFVNDHFCEISKYSREELVGKNHRILNSRFHPKAFFHEMWRTIGSGNVWKGDICNRTKDNKIYWVQTVIVPFLNNLGKPYQYIAIRADITAQKGIEKIQHMGLPNRRKLNVHLDELIKKAKEE